MPVDPERIEELSSDKDPVADAVAYAARKASQKIDAQAIIACTETGTSARLVAKYRPTKILFGASSKDTTLRRMALYRGVIPLKVEATLSHHQEIESALLALRTDYGLPQGALTVVISGLSVSQPGSTSILEIQTVR
jgi:pyruvate kinase